MNFFPIKADKSVFYNNKTKIIIAAHINNLLIFNKNIKDINLLKLNLAKIVNISNLGNIKFYLGIKIIRNRPKKELFLSQTKYIN